MTTPNIFKCNSKKENNREQGRSGEIAFSRSVVEEKIVTKAQFSLFLL